MKFSIVVCTLNSAQHLHATLASVASQTLRDFELVFVDGGSTDGTLQLIETVSGQVQVLHGVQGGIARAMNAGVAAAKGEIVQHLHSDDYLAHPRVLARVAQVFDSSGCRWLYGRTLSDVGGGWTPETSHFPDYSYRRLLRGNIIPHPATFIRRSLFEQIGGFDPTLRYAMDYDMWLRLGRAATPLRIPEFLSVFRSHPLSTTYANRMESFKEDHAVRRRYVDPLARIGHEMRHQVRKWRLARAIASGD